MAYADLTDLRKLAGGISTTTLSDNDLQDFLEYGDAMAEACTGLTNLPNTDPRYALMTQCAEFYASHAIRDHLSDKEKKADTHLARAEKICLNIKNFNLNPTSTGSVTSMSQGYKTYPLNPDGEKFTNRYVSAGETTTI